MEGWVKLHRSLVDNGLWLSEPFSRGQAWVDMLILANHESSFFYVRGIKVTVLRGQLGWSEPRLSERWKWSRTKLRNFLKDLEKEQQIIQQKDNVTQILTIVNYEKYQEKEQQSGQQKNSRSTLTRINKNDKEISKDIYSPIFEKFWSAYQRKGSKSVAFAEWNKLKIETNTEILDEMFNHVNRYVLSTERNFLKDAERYLKTKYWEGK